MNKTQKKKAGDYLRLLEKAHDEVRKALETKKYDVAMELLEQCQDAAIELGNRIEAAEGEGFVTIPLLENYCELTYQIHEEIWQKQSASAGKVYKSLRRSLIQIDNSVKHDIKARLEVVFLPYKASMWDSLESVWKAADEDPDCDAYVIPIPYYDKNPDGSFREMHYEGNEYPDYVPVTWYEDYDFANRQPDRIFIHNPYDNNNYVTSVHPFFYSENLKQYTEKLVYIPYFILGEVDPDNEQAVEGVAHFCTCPGVLNADEVIVQSEAMRQVYIKVLTKFVGEDSRKYWEKKILGLGSPKIDKVLSTRKEDLVVPEEWLKVIRKADGSWKKVVFYNTSVSALLKNGEQMLRKMEDVFHVFKENQEEVALLWRPHPLIKATIESMRPELWKAYEKIVEKYCSEGWGIYDDSADLARAIELSNIYYGDYSSITELFRKKHSLIVKQDVTCLEEDLSIYERANKIRHFMAMEKIDNYLFFTQITGNKLLKYNIQTDEYDIEAVFYDEPESEMDLFIDIVQYRGLLYFIPDSAKRIYEYNPINKKMQHYNIGILDKADLRQKFSGAFIWRDELIFLPWRCLAIVMFNLKSKCITYSKEYLRFADKLLNQYSEDTNISLGRRTCFFQNKIYLLLNNIAQLIEYNLIDKSCQAIDLKRRGEIFQILCSDSESVWVADTNLKDIFRIFPNERKIQEFSLNDENVYRDFSAVVDMGEYIWIFSLLDYRVFSLNKRNGKIKEIREIIQRSDSECFGGVSFGKRIGDEAYIMRRDGKLQIINISEQQSEIIELRNFHGWKEKNFLKDMAIYWIKEKELEMIPLSDFIKIITKKEKTVTNNNAELPCMCGTEIYNRCNYN